VQSKDFGFLGLAVGKFVISVLLIFLQFNASCSYILGYYKNGATLPGKNGAIFSVH